MKSEPDVFSIDNLKEKNTSLWDGVRNYQARNFMMKNMQLGDEVLFYHSNAKPSGVAGVATINSVAIPDPSQFDKKSEYFDAKSTKEKPIWYCVEVKFKNKFKNFISLEQIKSDKKLEEMEVIKKGNRLSIQSVTQNQFEYLCKLGNGK